MKRPLLLLLLCALATGCRQEMYDQPRYDPYERSSFFPDESSARTFVENTVARGFVQEEDHFFRGRVGGTNLVESFPQPVTLPMLQRGREQYDIFCAVCHGRTGEGNGMIVQRGFPMPPSMHLERLRQAPPGHFFDVITRGYGVMYSYASRVEPADRWAIVAYIRALQLSQSATLEDVPPVQRTRLEATR